ncbi:hypothetical protein EVJ50_00950 [Synechococcus sp. RSCCF101]|uniref:hypothetical protein n=1 Tax=Synechococcus sp. RSCCF101 TaxID=2511069 RepID=UPI00124923AC|nr:hypothetical protein [Synechococcus sp. RSCCF101]QEY31034.1 hypothetical protein EVJ50_00950 [Synechococcus sp. RSCCF101]
MVDGVLNWASLAGVLLLFGGLPLAVSAGFQLVLQLMGRARLADGLVTLALLQGLLLLLRMAMPAMGLVLILQGWRLDSALQLAVALLAIAAFLEAVAGTLRDLDGWQQRRRR